VAAPPRPRRAVDHRRRRLAADAEPHDLIVVSMNDERRDVEPLEIAPEVRRRECCDAFERVALSGQGLRLKVAKAEF
jgi:hypothetical protein